MKFSVFILAALLWAIIGSASTASANSPPQTLFTFSSNEPDTANNAQVLEVGNEFTMNSTWTVTAIGAWADPDQSDGVSTTSFNVDLRDNTGGNTNLLATATIAVGTQLNAQNFVYAPLTADFPGEYTFPAGDYIVTDFNGGPSSNTPYGYNGSGGSAATVGPGATFVENRYLDDNTGAEFPSSSDAGFTEYLGANLQYTVPEPASIGLVALGAMGLLTRRRTR
jgi:hypothetical protein